jgi:hypothetical protein
LVLVAVAVVIVVPPFFRLDDGRLNSIVQILAAIDFQQGHGTPCPIAPNQICSP